MAKRVGPPLARQKRVGVPPARARAVGWWVGGLAHQKPNKILKKIRKNVGWRAKSGLAPPQPTQKNLKK